MDFESYMDEDPMHTANEAHAFARAISLSSVELVEEAKLTGYPEAELRAAMAKIALDIRADWRPDVVD